MPTPVLARAERSGGHYHRFCGLCGAFTYIDDWTVTHRVPGWIIQKVTRTWSVELYVDRSLRVALATDDMRRSFDTSRLELETTTYWEGFDATHTGNIDGDQFQTNWFAPTNSRFNPPGAHDPPRAVTVGTYTITGEARFYVTNKSASQLGLSGHLAIAHGLPSTTTDPAANLTGLTASAAATRRITATWDSHRTGGPNNEAGYTTLTIT